MKKLFQNYNFDFTKNEKKLISTFCKQSLRQMEGDNKFYSESKALNSILDKLGQTEGTIKLTKDEKTRLTFQLKQNVEQIKKQMAKSWFIKKWLMKSLYTQYNNLLEIHFKN